MRTEIRVTLHHSGTCSAYKLKEKAKVCHRIISLLSTSWGFGLDGDHVLAAQDHVALKMLLDTAEANFFIAQCLQQTAKNAYTTDLNLQTESC